MAARRARQAATRRPKGRRRILRRISLSWMLPNLLTITALISGMTAIRFAFLEQWPVAVMLVGLAGVLDALDGRMARLLKASSDFGAHLDSLSDMVVFGVVPSVMLYLWLLQDGGPLAWIGCLYYTACCALRLARFNSELQDKPAWSANYFYGVPSPAAGFLALAPMVASFRFDWDVLSSVPFVTFWIAAVGTGAISTVPTFAGKTFHLPRAWALPALGLFALTLAAMVSRPWEVWILLTAIYVLSVPVSVVRFAAVRRAALRAESRRPSRPRPAR